MILLDTNVVSELMCSAPEQTVDGVRRLPVPAGLAVATRNVSDFEGMEVELFDPWASR